MGCDIFAYFYVNQEEIDEFILENNIDKKDWKQRSLIVDFYKTTHPEMKEFEIIYSWNRNDQIHDFFAYHGTNYIRDHKQLSDRSYHRVLEEKHNGVFPDCLLDINFFLRTVNDAIEIADALHEFFSDDDDLMGFANWCKITSKHCARYELSS